jgi:hypothetical protein
MSSTTKAFKSDTPAKEPAEGFEPSIYRLRSGCLATWPYRRYILVKGAQPKKIQYEYSGRGLNSRPSACKADVITTRLPEHHQDKKENPIPLAGLEPATPRLEVWCSIH